MLENHNYPLDPSALVQQQQPSLLVDADANSPSLTTSPSSAPPTSTPGTDLDGMDDDSYQQQVKNSTNRKRPNTRTKSGGKMAAASPNTSPQSTSTRLRRSRGDGVGKKAAAIKTGSISDNDESGVAKDSGGSSSTINQILANDGSGSSKSSGVAEKRRKRNLERNRAAASKCRQRKKQWQDGLERRKMELEGRYRALHSESKDLMEEIAQLKNFVMAHASCNDSNIDDWIRNEADTFVRRLSLVQLEQQQQHQRQQQQQQEFDQQQQHTSQQEFDQQRQQASSQQGGRGFLSDESGAAVEDASLQTSTTETETASTSDGQPHMDDEFSDLFATISSRAPFETTATNSPITANPLRSGGVDSGGGGGGGGGGSIFNQDLLLISTAQT